MQFRDIGRQYLAMKSQIDEAVLDVLAGGQYISGVQVRELEKRLADYAHVKHCITCGNGTDAIQLACMAWDVGPGDAVFVPDFTFFASAEAPAFLGATPVFVDVDPNTFNIDATCLNKAIEEVEARGETTPKAVIAVDLFGLPYDYDSIKSICENKGLVLIEDAAQGFAGVYRGRKACSLGDVATTSFFPAKPLGCYGDGGAIFTDDDEKAELLRSLAVHGKGSMKYDNVRIGVNSRLDTVQAAVLLVKLARIEEEVASVNEIASWYDDALGGTSLLLPTVPRECRSSWAQYTVRLPEGSDRDRIQSAMRSKGFPTMVYYPRPMHLQTAFAGLLPMETRCPKTEALCESVLSLPMSPYLTRAEVEHVASGLRDELKRAE